MLKKYYGNTLEEAREKARKELGMEKIAVLETVPPKDGFLASITVLIGKPNKAANAKETHNKNYSRADLFPRSLKKIKNIVTGYDESEQSKEEPPILSKEKPEKRRNGASSNHKRDIKIESAGLNIHSENDIEHSNNRSAEKNGNLEQTLTKPINEAFNGHKKTEFQKVISKNSFPELENNSGLVAEIQKLTNKVHHLESMLSEHIISPSLRYLTHPVYQQLLQQGIPAPDISGWFREVLDEGINPEIENNSFTRRLARILRRHFPNGLSSDHKQKKFAAFYGDSGAGKTTLIMKLANQSIAKDETIALISLYKYEDEKYSNLALFAEANNIDHFFTSIQDNIKADVKKLSGYDRILIDTPSLGCGIGEIVDTASSIHKVMEQLPDFESHLVINAAVHNEFFKEQYLSGYPLKPDFLAVSHLDKVPVWGHLLTLFNTIKSTPQYLTNGPLLRGDIITYTPEWFANKILNEQNT